MRAVLAVVLSLLAAGCSLVLDPSDLMGGTVDDGGAADATPSDASGDGGIEPTDGGGVDAARDGGPIVAAPASGLAAGRHHTCAIREADGAVFCWGRNEWHQAGAASMSNVDAPQRVMLSAPATKVSLGEAHSCALMQDRSVRCWGFDSTKALPHNRLGGVDAIAGGTATPVMVEAVSNATDLAVGFWHACAALDGGGVRCWGQNQSGELGSCTGSGGACDQIPGSASVPGVAGARVVGAGCGSSCAALSSSALFCWGYDEADQLGLPAGVVTPAPATLVDFDFPSTITQIAGGGGNVYAGKDGGSTFRGHLCAVSSELHCWGANDHGQVSATNVGTTISFPVTPGALGRVTHVALGTQHTCAVYDGGESVTCWGANGENRLGRDGGDLAGASDLPIPLPGPARSVAAGEGHSCALLESGAIYCWGSNTYGQVGVPGVSGPMPVLVPLPTL